MKLTKKEQKLLWLKRHAKKHNLDLTVGDYCRILHTTVLTLIGKTAPNLEEKIQNRINQVIEEEFD
ncbi:hypothetical protein NSA27_02325 [Clostridium tepidum]|uniref:hypothetical protein n=1 Tax=Clostridium tepidum TaxID=1962263 RepID=UPI00214A2F4C|nr:hypothetical protein [Clostridium tepidum]MCR1933539.1 hypothetical protein [Clostridium tepidum]